MKPGIFACFTAECYLVLSVFFKLLNSIHLGMKNERADRKSNRLIIVYGAVAVLFILCFQVYWLFSLYNNQEKLIVEEADNKLTEYRLSVESMELMKHFKISGTHTAVAEPPVSSLVPDSIAVTNMKIEVFQDGKDGKQLPISLTMMDSMFGPEAQLKKRVEKRKELAAGLKKSFPGIQFRIYDKKTTSDEGKVINSVSEIGPRIVVSLVLENLSYIVLTKIWPYIVLSFIYLLVCISAVVLLINSIRRSRRLMEQKMSFTNNMTHELKTPIATLYAATEALDKYNVLEDKKTAREYVGLMQADLNRLKNMADSILHNAKLSDGKLQLHKENLNLLKLLDGVVFNLRPRLEQLEAEVVYTVPDTIFINADEDHIGRVFMNLIDNSLKYANAIPKIAITAEKEGNTIKIIVADNGVGIPYKHHKDIFKPYFRIFEGNRHTVKGYGLGLSYVKEVIRLHGGSIKLLKDEQLKGAAFELIIPAGHE